MKPAPFDYADPTTLAEVLELLATHGDDAVLIAGGQSLVPLLNLRLARPELVIDLRRVPELTTIDFDERRLEVGAMVKAADLEEHESIASAPGLAAALARLGHSQIRARTTVGGSIAHADPAAELPALLLALDGHVTLQSRDRGTRQVGAAQYFVGPLMTAREPDELLTAVTFPVHPGRVVVDEIASRPGDFAIVGVVTATDSRSGIIADARVVVFGVAGTPVRIPAAEALLNGSAPAAEAYAAVASAVRDGIEPRGDVHGSADYRRHLAGVLVERALEAG